jgi:6-phosphogluconolactonase (cycloisomerase 2 family)
MHSCWEGDVCTDKSPVLPLSFPDGTLFTLHEFDSTVTAHTLNETTEPVVSPSIAPRDASTPNGAKFAAAELLSPPPSDMFPEGLLYASNRNVGLEDPRGDSIAIIRYFPSSAPGVKARFDIIEQVFTGLQQIRGMAFSGDGEFLVAGGSKSGGVKVFQRSGGGTVLTEIASNADVDTRTSFVWL